jgi:signal transduction histidine kinase
MQSRMQELALKAMDCLPQAVLIVDSHGKILARNRAGQALLPEGDDVSAVLRSPSGAAIDWKADITALVEEPFGLTTRNVTLAGRGSRQLLVDVYLRRLTADEAPTFDLSVSDSKKTARRRGTRQAAGDGQAVLVVVEDVSVRAAMERRLAASERLAAVGKVAAKVAHEMNNPLDGVLRYLGLAQRQAGQEVSQYLTSARAGLMRMVALIRDLLDQGKGRGGGAERAAIEKLLDEAVSALSPRAQALGVAIVCDLVDSASIVTDSNMFQVFCNVIKNSLDAMPSGGVLTIRLRRFEPTPPKSPTLHSFGDGARLRRLDRLTAPSEVEGRSDGHCVVEIADTGCGLSEEEAKKVFEPFYTTKPPGEGSGLGLAISREMVTSAGGTIAISPRKTGGAVVTITLPIQESTSLAELS